MQKKYTGLSSQEVNHYKKNGLINRPPKSDLKTIPQIIFENVFTFFNGINFFIALILLLIGSYRNLLFLGVVILNIILGIYQQLRARKILKKLRILSKQKIKVFRENEEVLMDDSNLVLNDLFELTAGNQVPVDCIILDGDLEVNESLLTGESQTILKQPNETLLSGSFIVSGKAILKAVKVGENSYSNTIQKQAQKKKENPSEIQTSIDSLIRIISYLIVPLGIIYFIKEFFIQNTSLTITVNSTAAAVLTLIPSGLVLLISTVFVISVFTLYKKEALIQNMSSVEALARTNVICLDKTGTLTQGAIVLNKVIPTGSEEEVFQALSFLVNANEDKNATLKAIEEKLEVYNCPGQLIKRIPFSSDRKFSGVEYKINNQIKSFILGAAEFIDKDFNDFKTTQRILAVATSNKPFENNKIPEDLNILGYLYFEDPIRPDVLNTIDYLKDQNIEIKIISGDNPQTVSQIAKSVGVLQAENYIDLSKEKNPNFKKLVRENTIFGRVKPEEKKALIEALKKDNNTVAMTGDGVNDVLALREANIGIAMASGSGSTRAAADIILLNSNFDQIPHVIAEGRKQINNLQRSASLYLSKTMFSFLLIFFFILVPVVYPFVPIQLTLFNSLTIGIPSFVLALEPNKNPIKGRFFYNILRYSIPSALSITFGILICTFLVFSHLISVDVFQLFCGIILFCCGILLIFFVSRPLTWLRSSLIFCLILAFLITLLFFSNFFYFTTLSIIEIFILLVILFIVFLFYLLINRKKIAEKNALFFEKLIFNLKENLNIKKRSDSL